MFHLWETSIALILANSEIFFEKVLYPDFAKSIFIGGYLSASCLSSWQIKHFDQSVFSPSDGVQIAQELNNTGWTIGLGVGIPSSNPVIYSFINSQVEIDIFQTSNAL
jgi:hypothetical protein